MVRGGGWAKSRTRWWLDTSVQFARGAHTVRVSRRASWFPFGTVLSSRPSLERDLFSYIRRWICACKAWTTTQRTNTKKTTEVILTQRGVFVYERPVQHRNWREWDRKRERRERERARERTLSCDGATSERWHVEKSQTNLVFRRSLKVSRTMCQFDKGWTWLCFSISIRSFHFPTRESVPFERPACFDNRIIESIDRLYSVCVFVTFPSRRVITVGFFGYVSRGKRREKWTSIRTTGAREWPTRAIRNDIRGVDGNRRHQDKSANHERTVAVHQRMSSVVIGVKSSHDSFSAED